MTKEACAILGNSAEIKEEEIEERERDEGDSGGVEADKADEDEAEAPGRSKLREFGGVEADEADKDEAKNKSNQIIKIKYNQEPAIWNQEHAAQARLYIYT